MKSSIPKCTAKTGSTFPRNGIHYNTINRLSLIAALGSKLNVYWEKQPEDILEVLREETKPDNWVCCDDCDKWRKLPINTPCPKANDLWKCSMNPDKEHNRCEMEEEPDPETSTKRQHNKKSCNEQPNAGKRKAGEDKEKETKRARGKAIESSRRSEDPENERTFSTVSDVREEEVEKQREEDQQTMAEDQIDEEKKNEETHLRGSRISVSADFPSLNRRAGVPVVTTDMQHSGPRDDFSAHNTTAQSINLQDTLHDAGEPSSSCDNCSFDGTDMETSNLVGHDNILANRECFFPNEELINWANKSTPQQPMNIPGIPIFSMSPGKRNSGSKKVSHRPFRTQGNSAPQTPTPASASNQMNSLMAAALAAEAAATHLPPRQQDTDLKERFDTFRRKVHDMLCILKPDEVYGNEDEIETTVENILAKYGPKHKN